MALTTSLKLLLVKFLNESITVGSWGVTDILVEESRLTFKVNGFLYQGTVEIHVNDSLYSVSLAGDKFTTSLDTLVSKLDEKIERTPNYTSDLIEWLEKQ
jgi:hypothetical protein